MASITISNAKYIEVASLLEKLELRDELSYSNDRKTTAISFHMPILRTFVKVAQHVDGLNPNASSVKLFHTLELTNEQLVTLLETELQYHIDNNGIFPRDIDSIRQIISSLKPAVVAEEIAEVVTVTYQSFEMDMTAATTDDEIETFVKQGSGVLFDQIDTDAIAERAGQLAQDRGYYTSSGKLTDADEIKTYLFDSARQEAQDEIDATVAGLIEARDETFAERAQS